MRNQAFIFKFKSAHIELRDHAVIINDTLQEKSCIRFNTHRALTSEHIFIRFFFSILYSCLSFN